MNPKIGHLFCMAVLLSVRSGSLMADGGGTSSGGTGAGNGPASLQAVAVDRFATARVHIAAKQWVQAISELQRVADPKDADWNNLMGYCARRSDPPDLIMAERYYQAALTINPKHLGTLEYLGEMRLQQGNLREAETELEALKKATFFKSREYKELQQAIAQYKSSGRYVASED
jgi:Flp pilus assembly protein TadD